MKWEAVAVLPISLYAVFFLKLSFPVSSMEVQSAAICSPLNDFMRPLTPIQGWDNFILPSQVRMMHGNLQRSIWARLTPTNNK